MSVFRGSIAEYPGVVVDNFTNCERGRAFFLSHCHKDHMTGLGSPAIFNTLQRRNSNLYCSEVTRSLLLKDPSFVQLAPFLKGLPMEQPVSMTLDPSHDCPPLNFTVTLLPAGHCPGSAMFFFQGDKGNVLYTGDFRLTLDETKRLRPLHCDNRLLDITSLYVDTTFCHPKATKIPSRDVSRDLVVNQIDSWLSQDPGNVVHLQCGMFGYEHIFMALARKFNTKIHIANRKINAYSELPSVVDCLTQDGSSTRIHCCNFRKGTKKRIGLPCGSFMRYGRPPRVLTIKPSTIWFLSTAKTFKEPFAFMPEYNMYRVLHSMHASYSEVCDFITYLKPRRIVPCVVPVGDASLSDVNRRLKMLLPQSEVQDTKQPSELKPATTNHVNQSRKRSRETEDHCKVEDFDSDNCDSSDDTIDEFISSEDISQTKKPRCFTSGNNLLLGSKHLSLPSMLSIHCSSAIGLPNTLAAKNGELKHVSETSSARSSGSVTVGSLQQTSLELSEDESSVEEKTTKSAANSKTDVKEKSKIEKKSIKQSDPNKNVTDNVKIDILQPSLDLSLGDSSPSQHKEQGNSESDGIMRSDERGKDQLPSDGEEWHLAFDGSSEEESSRNSLDDKKFPKCKDDLRTINHTKDIEDLRKEDLTTKIEEQNELLTPKAGHTMITAPTKRHKTCKERKKSSRERKRRSHHHKDKQTDLSTPVDGELIVSTTPRKLFHGNKSDNKKESQKQRKKSKKSKAERDRRKFKEADDVIDLTQENDTTCTRTKTVVTGSTKTDDVIKDRQKGEYPTQGQPCPPTDLRNTDHQLIEAHTLNLIVEPKLDETEADSDITFCEEGSEHYSILGSPSYLPPTPGRENVTSILKRKSIAFSE